ncbi:TonB-dependent receptor [Mucilaginibacter sp. CSA2-8R]|uniref:TonB-dependent receptor n=1 Tax=Mucilaginibacter sp. CSA2-8R TaxID=3141542 RepID=UPI00315D76C3
MTKTYTIRFKYLSDIKRNYTFLNKLVLIYLLLLLCLPHLLFSQTADKQFIIKGHVRSSKVASINGATVKIKSSNDGASTDSLGDFSFKTRLVGKHWVVFSSVGYKADSVLVFIKGDSIILNRQLSEYGHDIAAVTVTFRRNRIDDVKREYALNDLDAVTTPGAVADVVAALRTMPGASPAGNETGLFVHGGTARETQAFFDGLLVKNPFGSRLPDVASRSRFSAFLFKETAFSTAGYSVQYGQALSSALSLETKGLANKTSNEFSITSLGGGAAHTQRFKNSSLTVGANYYNFTFNNNAFGHLIPWVKDPSQVQTSLQYKTQTSKTGMLKAYADYSSTRLSFNIINPNTLTNDLLTNTNNNIYINTNYQDYLGSAWKVYTGVSYNYTAENGEINQTPYNQIDKAWQEKITFSHYINHTSVLMFGVEQFQNSRAEGYGTYRRGYNDVLSAGFSDIELPIGRKLTFKAGARFEYSSYLKKDNFAPRTSLAWYPNAKNSFILNWGTFLQKPDDSFLSQTSALLFEKAINYDLDYQLKIGGRNLRVQLYYKDYKNLVKIVTPLFSGFQAYGPPVTINEFNNSGYGYARGIDFFWRDSHTIKAAEFYIAYSYIDTKRNYIDFKTETRPVFAPAHTANLVGKKFVFKYRGQLTATYTFSSGRPYFNPNNPVFLGDRTGNNQNLSLGFNYLPHFKNKFSTLSFSVTNVLGTNNIYGYRYSYDGSHRESILPPNKRGYMISFLMNIGDGWFNH